MLTALAVTVTAGVRLAPAANAYPNTQTYIMWRGTPCIGIEIAGAGAPHLSGAQTVCGGTYSFSEGNIWPNDLFGANPLEGSSNATYIECSVWAEGELVFQDSTLRGGDANCLRRAR
jgi:hypothetical protein